MAKKAFRAVALFITVFSFIIPTLACSKKAADAGWKAEVEIVGGVRSVISQET